MEPLRHTIVDVSAHSLRLVWSASRYLYFSGFALRTASPRLFISHVEGFRMKLAIQCYPDRQRIDDNKTYSSQHRAPLWAFITPFLRTHLPLTPSQQHTSPSVQAFPPGPQDASWPDHVAQPDLPLH